MEKGGFTAVAETERFMIAVGTLALYRAAVLSHD
jgi:hypothetical protein